MLYSITARKNGLGPAFPINAPAELRLKLFKRNVLSKKYGGSAFGLIQKANADKVAQTGIPRFICAHYDKNPYLPCKPGEPGLLMRSARDNDEEFSGDALSLNGEPILVRVNTAVWQYLGQYKMQHLESLSVEEWRSLSPSVSTFNKSWAVIDRKLRFGRDGQT